MKASMAGSWVYYTTGGRRVSEHEGVSSDRFRRSLPRYGKTAPNVTTKESSGRPDRGRSFAGDDCHAFVFFSSDFEIRFYQTQQNTDTYALGYRY